MAASGGPGGATPGASGTPTSLSSTVTWRAITLLDLISRSPAGIGVREAARNTGIDRSAVSRLLAQLEEIGCVEQERERGLYLVGPRLFAIGAAVRARDSLWKAARPVLRQLVDKFGETCYLTVRDGDAVVFREKVDCDHRIRYVVELGTSFALTTGAAGRAILSAMTEEEIERVLSAGLVRYTEVTVVDVEEYRRELAEDRRLGYAVSIGRWVPDGAGVASPFFNASDACAGALTLSCPADRLPEQRIPEIGPAVREASRELSARLGSTLRWGLDEQVARASGSSPAA